ncbi:MAG: type VI secretion system-associated FHA domain protein TagH [Pseudomonadota bacterium]
MIKIAVASYDNIEPTTPISAVFDHDRKTLGRSDDNFLVLPDPKHEVSRAQAAVWSDGGRHTLINLSEATAIHINGREIEAAKEVELHAGDHIRIGPYLLRAEQHGPGQDAVYVQARPVAALYEADPANPGATEAGLQAPVQPMPARNGDPLLVAQPVPNANLAPFRPTAGFSNAHALAPGPASGTTGAVPALTAAPLAGLHPGAAASAGATSATAASATPGAAAATATAAAATAAASTAAASTAAASTVAASTVAASTAAASPVAAATGGAATPQAEPADLAALKDAFMRGAGLQAGAISSDLTPELMELLGKLLAGSIQGAIDLMGQRSLVKQEVKADVTVVVLRDNNPLKFFPDSQTVLTQMLRKKMPGFMGPVEAIADTYHDLKGHQRGVVAGVRASMDAMLAKLQPGQFESELKSPTFAESLMPSKRQAQMWDLYVRQYEAVHGQKNEFKSLFGAPFLSAYEKEIERYNDGLKHG